MRDTAGSAAKVIDFAAFSTEKQAATERKRSKAAKATEIVSSFHIEITGNGEIKATPIKVSKAHALAMLEICIAVSAHLVTVDQSTGT
jgi:hypothetical protein